MSLSIDDGIAALNAAWRREHQLQDEVAKLESQLTQFQQAHSCEKARADHLWVIHCENSRASVTLKKQLDQMTAARDMYALSASEWERKATDAAKETANCKSLIEKEAAGWRKELAERLELARPVVTGYGVVSRAEHDALKEKLEQSLADVHQTGENWASCRRLCQEWRESAQQYADQAKRSETERDQLRKDNADLKAQVDQLTSDRDELTFDRDVCRASLGKSEESVAGLVRSSETCQSQLDAVSSQNKHLAEMCSHLRSECDESCRVVDHLTRSVAALARCREAAWKAVAYLPLASLAQMVDACRRSSEACFCGAHSTPIGGGIEDGPASAPVSILYRNHRGEVAIRKIRPIEIVFESTEWHPEAQWLLEVFDVDKEVNRSFAMRDILAWGDRADSQRPAVDQLAESCRREIKSLGVLRDRFKRDGLLYEKCQGSLLIDDTLSWLDKIVDHLTSALVGIGSDEASPGSCQVPFDEVEWVIARVTPRGAIFHRQDLGNVRKEEAQKALARYQDDRLATGDRFVLAWRSPMLKVYEADTTKSPGDSNDAAAS